MFVAAQARILLCSRNITTSCLRACNTLFVRRRHVSTTRFLDMSYEKHGAVVTETEKSQQKSPVVVLLGWNGSKDKHLAKYSEIFTQKNYTTVRVTANPFNTFFRTGTKVKEIAHNILDILTEMKCEDRPVFLYAFSGGGGAVVLHIMDALTEPESKYYGQIKVVGSIFDSVPIPASDNTENAKIVEESLTGAVRNPVVKGLLKYSVGIVGPVFLYFNSTFKRYKEGLMASPLMCNQLVLYSKADPYAPYLDVEDYIDARRKQGVHVVAQCWEDSSHVNHYREHKDEYLELLNNFVDKCLAGGFKTEC